MTVRRFGWSSTGQEDADLHAKKRVEEAVAVLREGGEQGLRTFTRRERRIAYNGADGLPIREEVIKEWEHADVVVTRNSYGALCLNTPRAMFVDVDKPARPHASGCCIGAVVGAVAGAVIGPVILGGVLGAILFAALGSLVNRIQWALNPRNRNFGALLRSRLKAWLRSRPGWLVRIYETPAGLRLLVLHAEFDPREEESLEFMKHVEVDPVYLRMCKLQNCFRARVSPKPWRAGISDHFYAGGVWPVTDPDKLARRNAWIERYEERSPTFASCRFLTDVGDGRIDARVEEVRKLHDDLSGALSPRALA